MASSINVQMAGGGGGNLTLEALTFTNNDGVALIDYQAPETSFQFQQVASGPAKLNLVNLDETGSNLATFSAANAPATVVPRKWLRVYIGGVVGWLPWFSA